MEGVELIKKGEVPKIRRARKDSLKERFFGEFEKIEGESILKVDCKKVGCSLAGFRYVLKIWNETKEKKLKYDARNTRTNPVAYVSLD